MNEDKKLKFFEVYVDKGNLSVYLAKTYEDVEVSTFGLPEWDFSKKEIREAFTSLLREVDPHFVWFAPPCRKWSAMQRLNRRTDAQKLRLQSERKNEEKTHLDLVNKSAGVCKEITTEFAMEHPHGAESWKTETMKSMSGYFEAVCDRCQTGLAYYDGEGEWQGNVRKQTRLRTSSKILAESMCLKCQCEEKHIHMDGKTKSLREMQNYEEGFVKLAGDAIYKSMDENWRRRETVKILMAEEFENEEKKEVKAVTDEELKLARTHGKQALSIVTKLHRQLGHPGRDRLVAALKDASMPQEVIQCAKSYSCDICSSDAAKKLEKPSALPQAAYFNELLEIDVFHIRWNDQKKHVIAIIDIYSRFEWNRVLQRETEVEELKILEEWIRVFGPPRKLRTDSSGAHMSQKYANFMDDNGIKFILVPKEAHHRMGTVERLHAVRRLQLLKMKKEKPELELDKAVVAACHQRNRLRTVHGSSPAQIVFGYNPNELGLTDEPMVERAEPRRAHQDDQALRLLAARAFYEANHDANLRRALLAKPRKEHEPLPVGEYAYYWRTAENKLDTSRWRGPALICAIEPRLTDGGVPRPHVYWLAHGSALVRVAPEHIRPEVPRERSARVQHLPHTVQAEDVSSTVRNALQPVRGPIRFVDLAPRTAVSDATSSASPPMPEQVSEAMGETEEVRAEAARTEVETTEAVEVEAVREEPQMRTENEEREKHAKREREEAEAEEVREERKELKREEKEEKEENPKSRNPAEVSRTRSRSPPARDERALAFQSYNMARRLDGLPPVAQDDPAFQRFVEATEPIDEELIAETFNENKLNEKEKKEFSEAKDAALMVWIENKAWRAVPEEEAGDGEQIPARFLLRWKPTMEGKKANARVIIQGFRHKDVISEALVKESPTLSRLGRMAVLIWATHREWSLWSADVKSAFMQADSIDAETRIYVRPTADMRRRLERMMGLQPHEILKATKPAFGDVRAPRQWFNTADNYLVKEVGFVSHPLDRCVYLSLREAWQDDPEFVCFEHRGKTMVVDGVLGLHVDDFLGAGENVSALSDLQGELQVDHVCFLSRMKQLSTRFRFGSWDFGSKMRFCGSEITQSPDKQEIAVSLKEYVLKIKPITMEKSRKTMVDDRCTEKEHKQLRALVGAMSWPTTQCLPQGSALISLLQASINQPFVKDMLEANKCLRFLKEVVQGYTMRIRKHCELEDLRIGVYSDAAWSVRPDGSSQGGMLMFLASKEELESGKPFPLTVFDWSSKKLVRMCRSSLSAEAQASSIAVDELEWAKVFFAAMTNRVVRIELDVTMEKFGESPVLTDAKSLFDAAKSVTPGMKLSERRTAIEIAIIRERVQALKGVWRWVNSAQQLADGLTKPSSKDNLAYILSRGVHQLKYDPTFTAAKKVTEEDKKKEHEECEKAAKEMFDGQVFLSEDKEQKRRDGVCLMPGCEKKVDSADARNRYCSRRHYYAHLDLQGLKGDDWRKAAMMAVATLAAESIPGAEAAKSEEEFSSDVLFLNTLVVLVVFAMIGFGGFLWKMRSLFIAFIEALDQFEFLRNVKARVYVLFLRNDMTPVNVLNPPSHGAMANDPVLEENAIPETDNDTDDPMGNSPGSSSVDLDGEMSPHEWDRWYQWKKEVEREPAQYQWRLIQTKVESEALCEVSPEVKQRIIQKNFTTERWRSFMCLLDLDDSSQCTDFQIRQWHRHVNEKLKTMYLDNKKILQQSREIASLNFILDGLRGARVPREASSQTAITYNRRLATPRNVTTPSAEGSWHHS